MTTPIQPNFLCRVITILCFMCLSPTLLAKVELPAIDEKYIDVSVMDPARDSGYVVGSILSRKVTITIKKPYQLIKESLPIVGYEHRYRGKVSGIELAKINVNSIHRANSETYVLDLDYQVFKRDRVARPAALRAEELKMRNTENKKEIVQYKLPVFTFRISPLSVIGQIKLDQEMYPYTPPITIDNSKAIFKLKVLATILSLALLGLLYILGKHAWLPRMGAPFARAYRDIKKMSDSTEGLQQAVTRIHLSLNKTAGASLFSNNLDAFITSKPAFAPAKQEIEKFFGLSQQVFFEDAAKPIETENPKAWLLQLCRHLRNCERGLVPDLAGNNT